MTGMVLCSRSNSSNARETKDPDPLRTSRRDICANFLGQTLEYIQVHVPIYTVLHAISLTFRLLHSDRQ